MPKGAFEALAQRALEEGQVDADAGVAAHATSVGHDAERELVVGGDEAPAEAEAPVVEVERAVDGAARQRGKAGDVDRQIRELRRGAGLDVLVAGAQEDAEKDAQRRARLERVSAVEAEIALQVESEVGVDGFGGAAEVRRPVTEVEVQAEGLGARDREQCQGQQGCGGEKARTVRADVDGSHGSPFVVPWKATFPWRDREPVAPRGVYVRWDRGTAPCRRSRAGQDVP